MSTEQETLQVSAQEAADLTSSMPAVQEQPVIFEAVILDEKEPVQLTAALIREKSKVLTDLVIKDIFDEAGFTAVKAAKNKAVKTRTAIERIEKEQAGILKAAYDKDKKKLTDYVAELYTACKEVENGLQGKLDTITTAKAVAAKKLEDERKEKTEGRENAFYEAGMAWNGKAFTGFGKIIDKDYLFGLAQDSYEALLTEIQGLQMQAGIVGEDQPQAPKPADATPGFSSGGGGFFTPKPKLVFKDIIFERAIPGTTMRIYITNGQQEAVEGALVMNDCVNESPYYLHVIK